MNLQRQRAEPAAAAISGELLQLFTELSHVASERGITPKVLCNLLERSYAQAAAERSKLRNGRPNKSRIAAQTGLRRALIKRLLDANTMDLALADYSPVARVVNGWLADSQFLDASGNPKPLRIAGRGSSFARLVKKYGGDIPPRAILDELRRVGTVADDEKNLRLVLRKDPTSLRALRDLSTRLREIASFIRSRRRDLENVTR